MNEDKLPKHKRPRIESPDRDSAERSRDFLEVNLGFSEKLAILEAERCLDCKHPTCIEGCPVSINIPEFIKYITKKEFKNAYLEILKSHPFPCITGRVCPQETQCEDRCVLNRVNRPVNIGKLERFVGDKFLKENIIESKEEKKYSVGVVGSGPSALALAGELLKENVNVTIYEAFDKVGGVLIYGIPEFRLPNDVVNTEINKLIENGLVIKTGIIVGKTVSTDELLKEHDFLYLANGAGLPRFMHIEGEDLDHVMSANEFLTRINLLGAHHEETLTPLPPGKNVVVIGGGNVAMDAARSAKRLYENVDVFYRRKEENLSARKEEYHHALEEKINFHFEMVPKKIDEEYIYFNENEKIKADLIIVAIGTLPNKLMDFEKENIKLINNLVKTDENMMTSNDRIYAGGDVVTGAATVISAMGAGKIAAKSILKRLKCL